MRFHSLFEILYLNRTSINQESINICWAPLPNHSKFFNSRFYAEPGQAKLQSLTWCLSDEWLRIRLAFKTWIKPALGRYYGIHVNLKQYQKLHSNQRSIKTVNMPITTARQLQLSLNNLVHDWRLFKTSPEPIEHEVTIVCEGFQWIVNLSEITLE